MKKNIILLFCLFTTIVNAQEVQKINPKLQSKYLVPEIKGQYIGIAQKVIKKLGGKETPAGNWAKTFTKGNIKEITYQFADEKLYEFIIEYKSTYDLYSMMVKKYGEPNNDKEWLFELKDGLTLKIWYFNNKLCIADGSQFDD